MVTALEITSVFNVGICGNVTPSESYECSSAVSTLKFESSNHGTLFPIKRPIQIIYDSKVEDLYNFKGNEITIDTDILESMLFSMQQPLDTSIVLALPDTKINTLRDRFTELFFYQLNGEDILPQCDSVLATYACARTSAVSFKLSSLFCNTGIVKQGCRMTECLSSFDLTGKDLIAALTSDNYSDQFDKIKKLSFDTKNIHPSLLQLFYKENFVTEFKKNAVLPDGQKLVNNVFSELFCDTSKPNSLIECFKNSIKNAKSFRSQEMLSTVISFGEFAEILIPFIENTIAEVLPNQLFDSLPFMNHIFWEKKIQQEKKVLPKGWRFLTRENAVWKGASLVGCIEHFKELSITKKTFEEFGDSVWERFGLN